MEKRKERKSNQLNSQFPRPCYQGAPGDLCQAWRVCFSLSTSQSWAVQFPFVRSSTSYSELPGHKPRCTITRAPKDEDKAGRAGRLWFVGLGFNLSLKPLKEGSPGGTWACKPLPGVSLCAQGSWGRNIPTYIAQLSRDSGACSQVPASQGHRLVATIMTPVTRRWQEAPPLPCSLSLPPKWLHSQQRSPHGPPC